VVTGVGRTGRWFAGAATGCTPDIIATAKGLGAGYVAIGAVLVRDHVYEAFARGSRRFTLGHTWDGAPLACAVGLAVLHAMHAEGLIERVHDRGARLLDELRDALAGIPIVREVRGHGYLLGVSFVDPRDGESFLPPDLRVGGRIDAAAFDRALIVLSTQPTRDGYAGDQTLFAPAFTATDEELTEMVSRFADVVHEVASDLEPELERSEPVPSTPAGGVR
jgi:adenosylmethionine-8-amino-7-oxononanoate aminotransferase